MANVKKAMAFYNQGLRFLRCAERCLGDVNEDGSIQIIGGKYQPLSTPAMVNAAFACEIFLTSILILHDIEYMKRLKHGEGHQLKPLYDLLPKQEYKEFIQIGTTEEFEAELTAHSSDFESWRYYMEEPGEYSISPTFTWMLMNNLKALAHGLIEQKQKIC